jgi:hypothetical protein
MGRCRLRLMKARLASVIQVDTNIIAPADSRVLLDVSASLDGMSTLLHLSIRECRQADGKSLYFRSIELGDHEVL